jgi:hypothetical protein
VTLDIDKLEALARAATPGPWREGQVEVWNVFVPGHGSLGPERVLLRMNQHFEKFRDDATFIAAANPDVVLDLLAEHRRLQRISGAAAALRALLASGTPLSGAGALAVCDVLCEAVDAARRERAAER